MMKKLRSIIASLLTGCLLTSCGGKTPTETTKEDPPQSTFAYKAVVKGEEALKLSSILYLLNASSDGEIQLVTADSEPLEGEIVFGDTDREVTKKAKAALATVMGDVDTSNDDVVGYVIYKDEIGNVAVYWSDEYFKNEALDRFLDRYCDISVLEALSPGAVASDAVSISDRIYDEAWAKVEAVASPDVVVALKRLNQYIDGSAIVDWMANLWEPYICVCGNCAAQGKEIACYGGAFYYANSARDYEGFLPDVESTAQALGRLAASGAFSKYGNNYANALPDEIKQKIIRFCQSLQDEASGYFYHPQWGSSIGAARRGRDLGHATTLLSAFGAKPLYPTALDRLNGTIAGIASLPRLLSSSGSNAVSTAASASSFEESLKSEAAYLEWLYATTADIKLNTQGAHTLASVRTQIVAAGYLEVTIDYLDRMLVENYEEMKAAYEADPVNNPAPTGLWQKTIDYNAVWGLLKLYGFYNEADRALKYPVEAMRTCVAAIMIDADEGGNYHMNDVFNQWGAPQRLIANVNKHSPELLPELYAIAKENAAGMIDETIAKLAKFRQADATYGYNQGTSAPTTQGTLVSLGLPEGDVNAVALAMDMYNCVFTVLGLSDVEVKLCDYRDGERFIETISSRTSAVKIPVADDKPINFDKTPINMSSSIGSGGGIEYITDPEDATNNVLMYSTKAGKGDSLIFKALGDDESADMFVFEAKLNLASANIAYVYQIYLGDCYMLDLLCQDGKVRLRENATASNASNVNMLDASANLNEWFKLRIEYYVDAKNPTIKIYFNGSMIVESHMYYDSHLANPVPKNTFDNVKIWAMKKASADLLLDDVYVACKTGIGQ